MVSIYTDDFLSRYARGGVNEVLLELHDEQYFPGTEPVGVYPIHIIVKDGRTMRRNRRRRERSAACGSACARGDRSLRRGEQPDSGSV